MIKKFDDFISESAKINENKIETLKDRVDNIYPGDNIVISFPENFELEYYIHDFITGKNDVRKFICTELNVYHWDENDHYGVDYYFYEPEESYKSYRKGGIYNWTCKIYDLTKESKAKVEEYLQNTPDE